MGIDDLISSPPFFSLSGLVGEENSLRRCTSCLLLYSGDLIYEKDIGQCVLCRK